MLLGREWIHGVGAVPSTLHQVVSIWRDDGVVENIEADQSYFLAEVAQINRANFETRMAHIAPYSALGNEFSHSGNTSYAMKLDPIIGFIWRHDYAAHPESQDSDDEETRSLWGVYQGESSNV